MSLRPVILLLLLAGFVAPAPAQRILVDRHAVAQFARIPPPYAEAAARLRLLFMDRSVGGNIDQSLSCLAVLHADAPNFCRRYQHRDSAYAVDPSEVYWEGAWDRGRWRYEYWPEGCSEDADCFIGAVEPRIDSFDVVGFQHSYLAVMPGSRINDPVDGFFGSRGDRGAASYAAFAARHPEKTVIWWTTSLARGIGSAESQQFNEDMRAYARAHDLVLFDVADILSHDPSGAPCYDNRDGMAYLDEDHPDDGLDIPAICPQYTTETEGGHLGSISAGGIRVAKAFWVLMARIAGWDGTTGVETHDPDEAAPRAPDITVPGIAVSPNPARSTVSITVTLPRASAMRIELFDLLGRRTGTLYEGRGHAGTRTLALRLPDGLRPGRMYFLRLSIDGGSAVTALLAG